MFILHFLRKIRSYTYIRIVTDVPEKIINLLQERYIPLWDISYSDGIFYCKILNTDLYQAKEICERFSSKMEITQYLGFQKFIQTLFTYKAYIVIFSVFFALFLFFTQFIWTISVTGTRFYSNEEFLTFLSSNGIRQSILKKNIDEEEIACLLLEAFDELSDAQVSIRGVCLEIAVVEREAPLIQFDKNESVDLVATQDGIIHELEVYSGNTTFKVGDYVREGDVVISGTVKYIFREEQKQEYVHAMGKVLTYKEEKNEPFILNLYTPKPDCPYISEKTFHLFSRDFTFSKKFDKNKHMFTESKNNIVQVGFVELPFTYDEKRWYPISGCIRKSEAAVADEVNLHVKNHLKEKQSLLNITYQSEILDFYRINVYSYSKTANNLVIEKKIDILKNDIDENK